MLDPTHGHNNVHAQAYTLRPPCMELAVKSRWSDGENDSP